MAPNKFAELQRFHQEYNGGAPIVEEAEKHKFTALFAAKLAAEDPRWGRKARANNEGPMSKDTLGYWLGPLPVPTVPTDGYIDARDLLTSSGQDSWNPDSDPNYNNILANWIPVAPAVPQPEQPPTNPPEQSPVEGELVKLLESIDKRLENLEAAVANSQPKEYAGEVSLGRLLGTVKVTMKPVR